MESDFTHMSSSAVDSFGAGKQDVLHAIFVRHLEAFHCADSGDIQGRSDFGCLVANLVNECGRTKHCSLLCAEVLEGKSKNKRDR
jgi:hypothetical protein